MDLVQVTVSEGPHIPVGLSRPCVQVQGLPEDVILPWRPRRKRRFEPMASVGEKQAPSGSIPPWTASPVIQLPAHSQGSMSQFVFSGLSADGATPVARGERAEDQGFGVS